MRFLLLLLCAALVAAADSAAADKVKSALAGDDPYVKRDAVKTLADKSAIEDAVAYPLLVQAVGDRAAHDAAVDAFRARSGLTPPSGYMGGTAYPGYPASDDAAGYAAWVQAWTKAQAEKKKLDDLTKKPDLPAADKPADDAAATTPGTPPPRIPTDNLGKLDRIVYRSGRSLVAYVRSKRLDADGKLVSVRIVHRDGEGEEVIDASLIARIEEDIE